MKSTSPQHNQKDLTNLSLLITRPQVQSEALKKKIEACHGKGVILPLLEIVPLRPENFLLQQPTQLVIFTSRQAVKHSQKQIQQIKHASHPMTVIAVGPGTQEDLAQQGIASLIPAQKNYNSEGILALSILKNIKSKHVVIIGGEGGRTLLPQVLADRGAIVSKLEVYRRQCPQLSSEQFEEIIRSEKIDVILATSSESLINLLTLWQQNISCSLPLLVISDRMVTVAQRYGYHGELIQADSASDTAIIKALSQWRERLDNE